MLNGEGGPGNPYWDDTYNGAGSTTTDLAPLSGGLGQLTDGIIPTENFNLVEPNGPYVAWE
jgi:hypothetical protein